MKNIILAILILALISGLGNSQTKVNFTLENPRIQSGYFMYDLKANIPSGQYWRVGNSNIRINFTSVPTGNLTVKADNPAVSANANISGANGYNNMTTTSYLGGTVLSLNILTFNTSGFYKFNPGSYLIATVRWNATLPLTNSTMTFRYPPDANPTLVFDSTVQLTGTQFTITNPIITSNFSYTEEIPTEFKIYQNYPNPFNPTTSIKYDIATTSNVKIKVYDISGKEVADLVNTQLEPGRYEANFDAVNFASGVYFCRIETKDFTNIIRMLLIK